MAGKPMADGLVLLGAAIRAVLTDRGHTQAWLADRLGISESQVSRILAGRSTDLPLERVTQIENALELERGMLLVQAGYIGTLTDIDQLIAADPNLEPEYQAALRSLYRASKENTVLARRRARRRN